MLLCDTAQRLHAPPAHGRFRRNLHDRARRERDVRRVRLPLGIGVEQIRQSDFQRGGDHNERLPLGGHGRCGGREAEVLGQDARFFVTRATRCRRLMVRAAHLVFLRLPSSNMAAERDAVVEEHFHTWWHGLEGSHVVKVRVHPSEFP